MSTEQQTKPAPPDDSTSEPEACDPKVIDEVACRAAGVAKQAEYDKTYTDALAEARKTYDEVRKKYRKSRQDAARPAKELRHEIKRLLDRIRCLLEQRRVWECLDDAFCEVLDEIADCVKEPPGCCARERVFDVSGADAMSIRRLERLIKKYERWTKAAKDCFDQLAKEPEELTKRLDEVRQLVAAIDAALSANPPTTDLKTLYAQAKVAAWKLNRLYAGFDDVQKFVDCLCLALTTWTDGCRAVSELTRVLAYKQCLEEKEDKHCEALLTNTVDEILAVYDRLCGTDPCEPENGKPIDLGCDDGEHDDDHHHGKGKRHGCGCHDHDHDDGDEDEGEGGGKGDGDTPVQAV
jgi:hypothetical protein